MCGIAGVVTHKKKKVTVDEIKKMIFTLRHRGPDAFGIYWSDHSALGHARLSIIDLDTGTQPIHNEDRSLWLVFNGEIYNFVELRPLLQQKGHIFYTKTDTEVIIHAYEEYGRECVNHFNGQFAFAIWDVKRRTLFLARDRLGVRPLFYNLRDGVFSFASEIKALFTIPQIMREIDAAALGQIFTMWTTLPPRTPFKDIWQLQPGCTLVYDQDTSSLNGHRYWELPFGDDKRDEQSAAEYGEQLFHLLKEATRIRLRADVPVGAYLSGGLDSSIITSLIKQITPAKLSTFSIQFSDRSYDESLFQKKVIEHLRVDHHEIHCTNGDIARILPELIWHAESPLLRTAPAPLILLSKLVRDTGVKVVLTGEGADEMLAGYDIFRETAVRCFWSRIPESRLRPLLIQMLYPDLRRSSTTTRNYLSHFFKQGLEETQLSYYSHLIRWKNTARIMSYFDDGIRDRMSGYDPVEEFERTYGDYIRDWHPLHRAQFIESKIFLSNYLLSSQGDRVSMANSVEGRYPFLDHNLVEWCCKLPPLYKLRGLREKYILKKTFKELLPPEVAVRNKHPYRAPIVGCFSGKGVPAYAEEFLSEKALADKGYFKPGSVQKLMLKSKKKNGVGEVDEMALAGILSVQLLDELFIKQFNKRVEGELPTEVVIFTQQCA